MAKLYGVCRRKLFFDATASRREAFDRGTGSNRRVKQRPGNARRRVKEKNRSAEPAGQGSAQVLPRHYKIRNSVLELYVAEWFFQVVAGSFLGVSLERLGDQVF